MKRSGRKRPARPADSGLQGPVNGYYESVSERYGVAQVILYLSLLAFVVISLLSNTGLITYQTEYDPLIGCYIPTDITFTPALFAALDVSEDAVVAARRSRVEWENRQRKKQGLDTLGMDELIAKAWRFVRERFRSYQTELKSRGIKRARARRDANRERQDIVTLVKRQLTREISEGRFTANREAVKREVERRVKERMILSRNRNYSRLATASP